MKLIKNYMIAATISLITLASTSVQAVEVGSLEPVIKFNNTRVAGVTITPEDRIIVSMHPLDKPKYQLVEIMANGTKKPFPTTDWADGTAIGKVGLSAVIGIHTDSNGIVWILDMGSEKAPARLVAWDSVNDELHNTIAIDAKSLLPNSFIQDFAIDEKHGKIYIADMTFGNFVGKAKPAVIITDLKTGKSIRVLEHAKQLLSEDKDIVIEKSLLASKNREGITYSLRFGLNPVAIDEENEWLYFGSFTGTTIYRIPTSELANINHSASKLNNSIEVYGPKNPSDGIAFAPGGGVLTTDLENNAIGLTTKGKYQLLIIDYLGLTALRLAYVTQNGLHQHLAFCQGICDTKTPHSLYRFKYRASMSS